MGAFLSTVLTLSLSVPSEIFPYLVVVIGLENVLVLTKSVVSTPVDLEVKLRIAQGNGGVGVHESSGGVCSASSCCPTEPRNLYCPGLQCNRAAC